MFQYRLQTYCLQMYRQTEVILVIPHDQTGHDHAVSGITVFQRNFCDLIDLIQLVQYGVAVHEHGGSGLI